MKNKKIIHELETSARNIRINCLDMTSSGGSSHIGSCLSCVDILTVIYGRFMNLARHNLKSSNRNYFIMSKGHAGAAVYATLAEFGILDSKVLSTHYQNGSSLSGHVSHHDIPGVEFSTGSLGHGLSVSVGVALSQKRFFKNEAYVFCLLSDGELQEGSNWEAFMFASHYKLDNLIVLIDRNKYQSLTTTEDTLQLEPLNSKLTAFGWDVLEVDGHNHQSIEDTLQNSLQSSSGKPRVMICHTIKGKGVSFMENSVLWHYRTARGDEYMNARNELLSS